MAIYPGPLACVGNFNICPLHVNTVKPRFYFSKGAVWNEPHSCFKQCHQLMHSLYSFVVGAEGASIWRWSAFKVNSGGGHSLLVAGL